MTAISAPPGTLHFPLMNLGAGPFPDSESSEVINSLATTIPGARPTAAGSASPPRVKSHNPKTPSRLSSLHRGSMSSLTGSSPSKTPRVSTTTSTRETSMTELSFGSTASTPLKPETAPPQEKAAVASSTPLRTANPPKKMSDRKRGKKEPPSSLYSNAEAASLSTPELHLASDPLAGSDEQKPDARFTKRWAGFLPGGRRSPVDSSYAAVNGGAYSSIGAVIEAATPRTPSMLVVGGGGAGGGAATYESGEVSPLTMNVSRSSDESTTRSTVKTASRRRRESREGKSPAGSARGEDSTSPTRSSIGFFRRQRRWSATATPLSAASVADSQEPGSPPSGAMSDEELTELLDDDAARTQDEVATVVTAATSRAGAEEDEEGEDERLTPSAFTAASTRVSGASTAVTTVPGAPFPSAETETRSAEHKLRDDMHEATRFLQQEFRQLPAEELMRSKTRLTQLGRLLRSQQRQPVGAELQLEFLHFWWLIMDGVLLCMLAKHLAADVPAYPERFPYSSSAATNLSFFLKAARTQLRVSARDLFTVQEMTSQTLAGLQRVVHTMLVLRNRFQPESSRTKVEAREPSPPRTPIGPIPEGGETVSGGGAIPFPTDRSSTSFSSSPSRRSLPSVQQQRLLAERQLMGLHLHGQQPSSSSSSSSAQAQAQDRKRKVSDAAVQRPFAMFVHEPGRDDGNGPAGGSGGGGGSGSGSSMLYRDRKASESVASLTGVVEEESEAGDADVSGAFESPDVSTDFSRVERASSPRLSISTPTARGHSQARRLSTELGLGQPPSRAYRSSLDGSADMPFPLNGSPRLGPVRRHSSVARSPGPSLLNPHRDTPSTANASSSYSHSDVGLESTPRVPFPRSNSTYDSPVRRPGGVAGGGGGRYTSMSGAMVPSASESRAPLSDVGVGSGGTAMAASPSRTRPSFRHHRYSSDLHLPNPALLRAAAAAAAAGGNARSEVSLEGGAGAGPSSMSISGRNRVDSEVGSVFTTGSFTTQEDGHGRAKLTRDVPAPSKHKLVVTEGGQTVTYQIGQCIGRGQFGSVYKALNTTTGTMLAVKRIKLTGKSEKEITQLMKEVDLLKNLEHPSVVKYEGLVRTNDVLSIILEWVESGSLYLTLKNFGPFEEGLCASYVVQILEGLHYLHNRQVVHCDLKAANILTTKKGNIKLSDFGVSLNLQAMENIVATRKDAVGTPNWMAPEVIELQGASTQSDIWSLGCTIIEMLTGKPPYHDHNGLSAMYRIVEDECPPIPSNVSEPLRDFLRLCFQKEPSHRPSAEILFEHQWLKKNWTGHKQLKTKDSVPFLRRISADMRRVDIDTIESVPEAAMERSSSSPPETMARSGASDVAPVRRSVYQTNASLLPPSHSQSMDNIHALPSPVPLRLVTTPVPLLRHGSDAESYFGHGQAASMPSPAMAQNGFMANPSLLELERVSPMEDPQPHPFVKISFGKTMLCKICFTHVKKHAVFCEACGVVCHPSCASNSDRICPALSLAGPNTSRTPNERRRAATSTRGADAASSTSPPLPPTNPFRFPFMRNRRNSSAVTSSPEPSGYVGPASPPLLPSSPLVSADGSGGNRDASGRRRRRISLAALGRHRSNSPGMSSPEVLRSPSEASTRAFPVTHLPPGAVQMIGSLSSSGSSTVSRGLHDVTDITKAQAIASDVKPLASSPAIISTAQLGSHPKGILDAIRLPRRLSVGHPYGHNEGATKSRGHVPNHSISVVYTRDTEQSDIVPGAANGQSERSRLKRASKECIIM